jgi:DNA-directed RNA polymerase specialized sigma24 family protein
VLRVCDLPIAGPVATWCGASGATAAGGAGGRFTETHPELPPRQRVTGRFRLRLLEWLLRNGRPEKLCAGVARLTAAPHALVEDVFQEVCLKASRRGGCHGQSPGEVYNWLRRGTLNRVRDELKAGFERHELLVDWSDEQRQPHHTSAGADAEVLDREKRHELELPRMRDRVLRAARGAGRDGAEITCVLNVRIGEATAAGGEVVAGRPDAVVEQLADLVGLGFAGFSFVLSGPDADEQVELLARDVLPELRRIA